MKYDTIIKNGKVVIPNTGVVDTVIAIKNGKITALFSNMDDQEADTVIDADGKYILPGLIDPHVHWGLYGATLSQQTVTESKSAAIGGVTTALHYQRRPEFTKELIDEIVGEIEPHSYIDFSLQLFVTENKHVAGIKTAVEQAGISSFKFFMTERNEDSGINGIGATGIKEPYTDGFCYDALLEMGKYKKVVGNFHAENIEILERLGRKVWKSGKQGLSAWNEARPEFLEAEATSRMGYIAEATGCPVYIVHISCKSAADEVARFKAKNVKMYGETCPHYLVLNTESPIGILAKVNPPIRPAENNEALWTALRDGTIDTVGSDNCGGKREIKEGDIWTASPGFAGSATILPVLLSEGVNKGRLSLDRLAQVTSLNAAKIFNLYPRKGTIAVNSDADLVFVDLDLEKEVDAEYLQSWSDFSVFEGMKLKGWPTMTMVRGKVIMQDGQIVGSEGHGNYLKRNDFITK